ncbi:hypothetical protein [Acinetobacter venetianus]|uniref:hypothetical protein n=1 Tax=Acinetobacter venetianus TaxID=52133 RepID=UPI001023BBDA|nr:hypothetical protein [Acinetobacter venetianus]RZG79311.1 hypothetical protein EXE23_14130 [Acinetobacter venetianus]
MTLRIEETPEFNDFNKVLYELREKALYCTNKTTTFYNELKHLLSFDIFKNSDNRNLEMMLFNQRTIVLDFLNKINSLTIISQENTTRFTATRVVSNNFSEYLRTLNKINSLVTYAVNSINSVQDQFDVINHKFQQKTKEAHTLPYPSDYIFNELSEINSKIRNLISNLEQSLTLFENLKNLISNEITIKENEANLIYRERFEEEIRLILNKYQHEVENLTNSFKNQFKKIELEQEKINKSSNLLIQDVDLGLKNLADLNNRTQTIELEYSRIITSESEKIKKEISNAKIGIEEEIDKIVNKIKNQSNAIKLVYADHIKMAENAALYELTDHYKVKAEEEKIEYKDYRKFTSLAIWGAITSTLSILCYTIWEQYHPIGDKVVDISFLLLLSRLSISLMFFVLALYLSKQAAKHYECYQENHRTYLQLSALEPFISRMTDEEKKEIRKGLIPSYFNQANDGKYASKSDEVDLSSNMTNIFNKLIEKIPSKSEEPDPKTPKKTPS